MFSKNLLANTGQKTESESPVTRFLKVGSITQQSKLSRQISNDQGYDVSKTKVILLFWFLHALFPNNFIIRYINLIRNILSHTVIPLFGSQGTTRYL